MTFREKLMKEHPECVGERFGAACEGCPSDYGYEDDIGDTLCIDIPSCGDCWNREMPEERSGKMRFKVGDKVRVREDLVVGEKYGEFAFSKYMSGMKGLVCEVKEVNYGSYNLCEDKYGCHYTDEMLLPAEFTKSDLKDGMICTTRDGDRWIWFNGYPKNCRTILFASLIEKDLKHKKNRKLDIVKISILPDFCLSSFESILIRPVKDEIVLWERKEEPEPKKMTVSEIEKLLGHPVEIVSEV